MVALLCMRYVLTLDDLPIIRDNIKKGWSSFLGKVKSKLDGEPEQAPSQPPRPIQYSNSSQTQRYDADPRVLGDDFSHLNIQDQPRTSNPQSHRPLANPNLFKSTRFTNSGSNDDAIPPPKPPRPETQSPLPNQPLPHTLQSKKWEPLRPAEDRDPFAVGDSDDEEGREDIYGTPSAQ